MDTTPDAIIWVCQDCHYAHHSGEQDASHYTPGVEPWALVRDEYTVTDWTVDEGDEDAQPVGVRYFDTTDCGGCGTTLAGERYRFALWIR